MGKPLILYGLAPILNPSFEDDADLAPPSSWEDASVNGVNEVSATYFQSPGQGLPSARSCRQNVSSGAAGNKAILRQRLEISELLALLGEDDGELAAVASLRADNQTGLDNAILYVRQYDSSGSSSPGTGVLLTAPAERSALHAGTEWYLKLTAVKLHADTAWVDVELVYDIAVDGYDASGSAYWDRVMLGGLVDLDKGLTGRFRVQVESNVAANEGDGVIETVRTMRPRSRIDAELENILPFTDNDRALEAFERWIAGGTGTLAIWRDRDELTNRGRHFELCILDKNLTIDIPAGLRRDNYQFRFWAPAEGTA